MTGQLLFIVLFCYISICTFKGLLISTKSEQFMNRIKNKEIYNIHLTIYDIYIYMIDIMELYFIYYQCNETVTQLV